MLAGRDSKSNVYNHIGDFLIKKMKTVFLIQYDNEGNANILNEVRPENEWVLKGEGLATIKFDGTAAIFLNGILHKRFDRKLTKRFSKLKRSQGDSFVAEEQMFRTLPEGAIPCDEKPDLVTHHHPHWIPVDDSPENSYFQEALENNPVLIEGQTYELVGEKVQGNPENITGHELWMHGSKIVNNIELTFEGIKSWLKDNNVEGLVFHHPDGRMCKLRRCDFNLSWNNEELRK